MNKYTTYESKLLEEQERLLSPFTFNERLMILERTASIISGADYPYYCQKQGYAVLSPKLSQVSDKLAGSLSMCSIPVPFALSSLSREPIPSGDQKKNGVFYTDFRLASLLANDVASWLSPLCTVADFACGSGILIASLAYAFKSRFPREFDTWIRQGIFAFDLSPNALRAAAIPFLSLTADTEAVLAMSKNWKCQDSLLEKGEQKFDIIIGNPPWGKIKLSQHQFNSSKGFYEAYGTDVVKEHMLDSFNSERKKTIAYSRIIKQQLSFKQTGDLDMYMAFLDLAMNRIKDGGHISFLVPSGLIHSMGTKTLREKLFSECEKVSFSLMDNKAHFFTIDSRFKIVHASLTKKQNCHEDGCKFFNYRRVTYQGSHLQADPDIYFEVEKLRKFRKDLTIPEFPSQEAKELFFRISESGTKWNGKADIWKSSVMREVDMTNDRDRFCSQQVAETIPLIEGRMVQQYRFGAKTYVSGKGRKAIWKPTKSVGKSQFFYRGEKTKELAARISKVRAGYCDIAGQTNERSVVSALIPKDVVCGNKVPTILFDFGEDVTLLWIGITNSFVFDWLARRVISTTLNYFLLFSLPLPKLDLRSNKARSIIEASRKLCNMGDEFYNGDRMEPLRAEIDAIVALMYGLTLAELQIIMNDFPLLDRKQKPLPGEKKSTVTRDCFFAKFCEMTDNADTEYSKRYRLATKNGAKAYIPTEMADLTKE